MRFGKLALAALFVIAASTAQAQTPALLSFTSTTSFPSFNSTNQTIGWSFTANNDISVTDLGVYDTTPATRLGQSHQVGIFSITGTLLGSTTVQTNSPLTGSFRYASVTPFTLTAGQTYLLGEAITSPFSDVYFTGSGTTTTDPAITFGQAAVSGSSSGFAAPTTLNSAAGRFGPNFKFTSAAPAVPEPGSIALLTGMTLTGAAFLRRRKQASKAA